MKKITTLIIAVILCFCFVACDDEYDYTNGWNDLENDNQENSSNDNQGNNSNANQNNNTTSSNEIRLPASSNDYKNQSYIDALDDFEAAGFTNIKLKIIYDLVTGWLTSDGEIEEVLVNGSSSFTKGDVYQKDTEIIIVYHTWESDEPQITMPNYSWHYDEGWTVEDLVSHFEQLGFTNIEIATTIDSGTFSKFHQEGEIYNVEIEDTFLGGWDSGDIFGATSLITITYYERTPTLTIDNCPDLASVLSSKDMVYTDFAEKYDGQFIEFDACVTSFVKDITGKVVSISVLGGDVASNALDNSDIAGYIIHLDTELTAGDEAYIHTGFEKGAKVKVIAKIDDYHTDYYKTICAKAAYIIER
ncbi:MAG: DUF4839 domain-containing protein [Clostridia bacterium]|nr:DUF4839 domain-containing protein [Clostridia bacterium]